MTDEATALRHSLALRQAVATLLIVLLLGLVGGGVELLLEWRGMRAEIAAGMEETLGLTRASAEEAAYQLSPDLAAKVVDGLFQHTAVAEVRFSDNFGKRLAQRRRDTGGTPSPLAQRLFGDVGGYALDLFHREPGGPREAVGRLEVTLAAPLLAERFYRRVAVNAIGGALRALIISLLVVLVFYRMITRPLLRLTAEVTAVDPAAPGRRPVAGSAGHERDELGRLAASLNALLTAFQRGLHQRDAAQQELRALTAELERRVEERTAELQRALAALAQEKEETERAFHRLDETHRELDRTNQLLLEGIRYARRIQGSMLPDPAVLEGVVGELRVCWRPLQVVSGDYYWLERFGDRALIVVADCTGHGVPGAFITLVVASALDRLIHEQGLRRPAELLTALDRLVRERLRQDGPDSESDDGLEAAACLYDAAAGTLAFAGANLPLLIARGGGTGAVEEIKGTRASLGYRRPPRRGLEERSVALAPGDVCYLLTDGIVDHMGGEPPQPFGRQRLEGLVAAGAGLPLAEQLARIEAALEAYRGAEPRRDDMTLIGFRGR